MGNHEAVPTKGQRISEPNHIPMIRKEVFLRICSSSTKTQDVEMASEIYAPGKLNKFSGSITSRCKMRRKERSCESFVPSSKSSRDCSASRDTCGDSSTESSSSCEELELKEKRTILEPTKTADFSWNSETLVLTYKKELELWELTSSLAEYTIKKISKYTPENNLKDPILEATLTHQNIEGPK